MKVQRNTAFGSGAKAVVASGLTLACLGSGAASGQSISAVPDAQVEANVLKALATAPELSTQDIQSSTVYGVVTLSGTVQTEALRTRAENLSARATGVKKVVDELTLGTPSTPAPATTGGEATSNGADGDGQLVLQSDGTYAPSASPQQPAAPYAGPAPGAQNQQPYYPTGNAQNQYPSQPAPPAAYGQPGPNQAPYGQPAYGQQAPGYSVPAYGQPGYGQQGYGQQGYAQGQQLPYPPANYAPQGGQAGGVSVTIPSGALLRIRIQRGLDSNHIKAGTPFDGTVLSDIAAGGLIAVPRGAMVQGVVVDSKKAGALKGEGELALQINSIQMGGTTYPITSDVWEQQGRDKSVRTVNSALGLGVLGAIVGGVAGGGAGAAIGAGVGAGAGVASSAASPGGRVIVPPEAVLTFHVAQPAEVRTVSEGEMQRLAYAAGPGSGAQPLVRRRYYAPGYGPYGNPGPYPQPY